MLGRVFAVAASLELCQVTVIVTLHLEVKHLGLARGGSGDKVIVQQLQDAGTDVAQLLLHLHQDQLQACQLEGEHSSSGWHEVKVVDFQLSPFWQFQLLETTLLLLIVAEAELQRIFSTNNVR